MELLTENLEAFCLELQNAERAQNTIASYRTDIRQFIDFAQDKELTKAVVIEYKKHISTTATSTQNRKIIAINKFLRYIGRDDCTVQVVKVQKSNNLEDNMSKAEYERCLKYALVLNKPKYWHIMKTLAGTGIRISELKYITVEAAAAGKALVYNKGKKRTVPIYKELGKMLKAYAKKQGITNGAVFITSTKNPINRYQVHTELKKIAGKARVKKSKIHAHAFRHLFALEYLKAGNNIAELADILGHSSLETTRIYLRTSTRDKAEKMGALGL